MHDQAGGPELADDHADFVTIHAQMTADELVAEKVALDPLFAKMAQDSYDAKMVGQQILKAALSAGISLALTAAGF